MYLTKEILDKYHACGQGREWFDKNFPDGAELVDVINRRHVPFHVLHWGFENFSSTPEEKEAYYAATKIIDCPRPHSIYKCDNVTASDTVFNSNHIGNSRDIRDSSYVNNCQLVHFGDVVENSNVVINSSFVFDSERVVQSKNVNGSTVVYRSEFVVNSRFVHCASNIENSYCVVGYSEGRTRNIRNCSFVTNCVNLTDCLFCSELSDAENCLFNKPVSHEVIEQTKKQLALILRDWEPVMIDEDGSVNTNLIVHYRYLPERFYNWLKTLPGYDPMVVYGITFKEELILE